MATLAGSHKLTTVRGRQSNCDIISTELIDQSFDVEVSLCWIGLYFEVIIELF